MSPEEQYSVRLRVREEQVAHFVRQVGRIGAARLSTGVAFIATAWVSLFVELFSPGWSLLPAALFAALVAYDLRARRQLLRAQRSVAFYRLGKSRLDDRWIGTGLTGERFVDLHHVYSADLDLFGTGGLFELLCLARTRMGEERLARWLLAPAQRPEIESRNEAVSELRTMLDLREELAILGEHSTVGVRPDELLAWSNSPNRLDHPWLVWLPRLLAISAVIGGVVAYSVNSVWPLIAVLMIEAAVVLYLRKQLSAAVKAAESTFDNLDLLAAFLSRFERERFRSPWLTVRMEAIRTNTVAVSRAIATLRAIVQRIQSRRNMFMAVLDVPLMITVRATVASEAWRRRHGPSVQSWLDVVADLEAIVSIATYSYEHPDDPFPELADGAPVYHADAIAHPLLAASSAIRNDVAIDAGNPLWIVSGSNMSGKSTLLRTVGINAVLAMAGAPVRATKLRMTCLQVGASIRVNDSLQEGSSRFYAEILRLKKLFELSTNAALLVLLDELLQGTNSADRREGAQGIVRALIKRGAIGLISTHDLALTDLGEGDMGRIANVHFQDGVTNGKMSFDFKLRPGIVTQSNALALMRAIGLDI